ncbi:MAG: MBL fold metallo-hydrolase, partial [Christensenellaceae bacterium]|nr:MBL fold metallo-hydrolase [Christensenellaceae bacterium]
GGKRLLIDTGLAENYGDLADLLRREGAGLIHTLVLTHPHADHIGGAAALLEEFGAEAVYMPAADHASPQKKALDRALKKKGILLNTVCTGDAFTLGGLEGQFLGPIRQDYADKNDGSAVLRLTYGNVRFLMMGDACREAEDDLLAEYGRQLEAQVLKVGHHGMKDATGKKFLAAVHPQLAVLTGDERLDGDHMNKKVLERLKDAKARVLRTDRLGAFTLLCDGQSVDVQMEE